MISPHFPRGSKITRQVACKKIASCKQVLHGRALFCFLFFFVFVFVSAFFFFGGGGGVKKTPSGVEIHCSFASCSFSCLNTPTQLAFTNCLVPLFS